MPNGALIPAILLLRQHATKTTAFLQGLGLICWCTSQWETLLSFKGSLGNPRMCQHQPTPAQTSPYWSCHAQWMRYEHQAHPSAAHQHFSQLCKQSGVSFPLCWAQENPSATCLTETPGSSVPHHSSSQIRAVGYFWVLDPLKPICLSFIKRKKTSF